MTFLEAFLWGSGLSLGLCVGLVVWTIVRMKIFGMRDDTYLAISRKSVEALHERNRLTVEMIEALELIAERLEPGSS